MSNANPFLKQVAPRSSSLLDRLIAQSNNSGSNLILNQQSNNINRNNSENIKVNNTNENRSSNLMVQQGVDQKLSSIRRTSSTQFNQNAHKTIQNKKNEWKPSPKKEIVSLQPSVQKQQKIPTSAEITIHSSGRQIGRLSISQSYLLPCAVGSPFPIQSIQIGESYVNEMLKMQKDISWASGILQPKINVTNKMLMSVAGNINQVYLPGWTIARLKFGLHFYQLNPNREKAMNKLIQQYKKMGYKQLCNSIQSLSKEAKVEKFVAYYFIINKPTSALNLNIFRSFVMEDKLDLIKLYIRLSTPSRLSHRKLFTADHEMIVLRNTVTIYLQKFESEYSWWAKALQNRYQENPSISLGLLILQFINVMSVPEVGEPKGEAEQFIKLTEQMRVLINQNNILLMKQKADQLLLQIYIKYKHQLRLDIKQFGVIGIFAYYFTQQQHVQSSLQSKIENIKNLMTKLQQITQNSDLMNKLILSKVSIFTARHNGRQNQQKMFSQAYGQKILIILQTILLIQQLMKSKIPYQQLQSKYDQLIQIMYERCPISILPVLQTLNFSKLTDLNEKLILPIICENYKKSRTPSSRTQLDGPSSSRRLGSASFPSVPLSQLYPHLPHIFKSPSQNYTIAAYALNLFIQLCSKLVYPFNEAPIMQIEENLKSIGMYRFGEQTELKLVTYITIYVTAFARENQLQHNLINDKQTEVANLLSLIQSCMNNLIDYCVRRDKRMNRSQYQMISSYSSMSSHRSNKVHQQKQTDSRYLTNFQAIWNIKNLAICVAQSGIIKPKQKQSSKTKTQTKTQTQIQSISSCQNPLTKYFSSIMQILSSAPYISFDGNVTINSITEHPLISSIVQIYAAWQSKISSNNSNNNSNSNSNNNSNNRLQVENFHMYLSAMEAIFCIIYSGQFFYAKQITDTDILMAIIKLQKISKPTLPSLVAHILNSRSSLVCQSLTLLSQMLPLTTSLYQIKDNTIKELVQIIIMIMVKGPNAHDQIKNDKQIHGKRQDKFIQLIKFLMKDQRKGIIQLIADEQQQKKNIQIKLHTIIDRLFNMGSQTMIATGDQLKQSDRFWPQRIRCSMVELCLKHENSILQYICRKGYLQHLGQIWSICQLYLPQKQSLKSEGSISKEAHKWIVKCLDVFYSLYRIKDNEVEINPTIVKCTIRAITYLLSQDSNQLANKTDIPCQKFVFWLKPLLNFIKQDIKNNEYQNVLENCILKVSKDKNMMQLMQNTNNFNIETIQIVMIYLTNEEIAQKICKNHRQMEDKIIALIKVVRAFIQNFISNKNQTRISEWLMVAITCSLKIAQIVYILHFMTKKNFSEGIKNECDKLAQIQQNLSKYTSNIQIKQRVISICEMLNCYKLSDRLTKSNSLIRCYSQALINIIIKDKQYLKNFFLQIIDQITNFRQRQRQRQRQATKPQKHTKQQNIFQANNEKYRVFYLFFYFLTSILKDTTQETKCCLFDDKFEKLDWSLEVKILLLVQHLTYVVQGEMTGQQMAWHLVIINRILRIKPTILQSHKMYQNLIKYISICMKSLFQSDLQSQPLSCSFSKTMFLDNWLVFVEALNLLHLIYRTSTHQRCVIGSNQSYAHLNSIRKSLVGIGQMWVANFQQLDRMKIDKLKGLPIQPTIQQNQQTHHKHWVTTQNIYNTAMTPIQQMKSNQNRNQSQNQGDRNNRVHYVSDYMRLTMFLISISSLLNYCRVDVEMGAYFQQTKIFFTINSILSQFAQFHARYFKLSQHYSYSIAQPIATDTHSLQNIEKVQLEIRQYSSNSKSTRNQYYLNKLLPEYCICVNWQPMLWEQITRNQRMNLSMKSMSMTNTREKTKKQRENEENTHLSAVLWYNNIEESLVATGLQATYKLVMTSNSSRIRNRKNIKFIGPSKNN